MMHPDILRAITRRHFFKQSGFGIGGLALSALLDDRLFAQAQAASLRRRLSIQWPRARRISRRRPRTSSICSWPARRRSSICSTTSRRFRSTTARRFPRSSFPRESGSRSSRARLAARIALHVQAVRPVGRRTVGAASASGEHRRRHRDRPLGSHDAVQPRARADLHEHGQPGVRPAEHGLVAHLRARQRKPRPARLRRAAVRRERARRRKVVLGERVPADGLPGRRVPIERATRCCSSRTRTASTRGRAARRRSIW